MKKDNLPQLYLLCDYCKSYFEYSGGKRRKWCSNACKQKAWRKTKDS